MGKRTMHVIATLLMIALWAGVAAPGPLRSLLPTALCDQLPRLNRPQSPSSVRRRQPPRARSITAVMTTEWS